MVINVFLSPDVATLNGPLVHKTFLDEIVFWTVKFEFPQKLVCLLLNMLPDTEYEVRVLDVWDASEGVCIVVSY